MTSRKLKFDVVKIETKKKDQIEPSPHPDILPKACFRALFTGASRSGKTNLMLNLITRDEYFGKYFDIIFVFAPTAYIDDAYEAAIGKYIAKQNVFTTPDPAIIEKIIETQKAEISKNGGVHKAPKILIIFDDVADNKALLASKAFATLFFRGRHYSISTMISMQAYQKVPKSLRSNMSNIFIFRPNKAEIKFITDELCPGFLEPEQFRRMIFEATLPDFQFFQINLQVPKMQSYRIGLNKIIDVKQMINNNFE